MGSAFNIFLALFIFYSSVARPSLSVPVPEKDIDRDNYEAADQDEPAQSDSNSIIAAVPIKSITPHKDFEMQEGETVEFPCQFDGKPSGVMWKASKSAALFVGKAKIIQDKEERLSVNEDHSLRISNIRASDADTYTCQETAGSNGVTHTLTVISAPTNVQISPKDKMKTLMKGESVTLTCSADGVPPPNYTWRRKGRLNDLSTHSPMLQITKAAKEDEGTYECLAYNKASRGPQYPSASITIHVTGEKIIDPLEPIVYTGEGEKYAELTCYVQNNPNLLVTWYKGNIPIATSNVDKYYHAMEKDYAMLRINNINVKDYGAYHCIATDKYDGTKADAEIKLVGIPRKPILLNSTSIEIGSGQPTSTWEIDSFSPLLAYEISYKKQDESDNWTSNKVSMTPTNQKTYVVKEQFGNLQKGIYHITMRAQNKDGWSELSEPHLLVINDDGRINKAVFGPTGGNGNAGCAVKIEMKSALASLLVLALARFI